MERSRIPAVFRFAFFIITLVMLSPSVSFAETDVTDKIELIQSGMIYDRRAGTTSFDVSLKNISQDVLLTPIKVVFESISDPSVTVANADGVTDEGKPYYGYSLLCVDGSLTPWQESLKRRLVFNNPRRLRFSYQAAIFMESVSPYMPASTQAVSMNISNAEGGTITINDPGFVANGFEMIIPAGALPQDTTITISEFASNFTKCDGFVGLNLPLKFQPSGLQFLAPITIKVPYCDNALFASGNIDLSQANLYLHDETTGEFESVPILSIDTQNGIITAQISHFSIFDVIAGFFRKIPDWDKEIVKYARDVWQIAATPDEISQAIYNEDLIGIPLKTPISALLAGSSIYSDLMDKDYKGAAYTASGLGIKTGLSLAGFPFLSMTFGFAYSTYSFFDYMVDELDDGAFNTQVSNYVKLVRELGVTSEEELLEYADICDGWLPNPGSLAGIGLTCKAPKLTGKYTIENVFSVGSQIVDILENGSYSGTEEEALKSLLAEAIELLRAGDDPMAVFSIQPASEGIPPFTVSIDATASYAKVGSLIDYQWDFGDGQQASGVAITQHTYEKPGNYKIALIVTDDHGKVASHREKVFISYNLDNELPVPNFTYSIAPNYEVSFDASSSSDLDGNIIKYEWTFGDYETGTGENVTHIYHDPGTYTAKLKITDNGFGISETTSEIKIRSDFDEDGIPDDLDAFPQDPNEWEDTDSDGIGNNADTDDDNDGYLDTEDAFPLDASEWLDSDSDGVGDNADLDDDDDNVYDTDDNCPYNANPDQADSDGDGIGDVCDPDYNDLEAGLVAYYPFNGNSNDESGNGNDGTEYGGVTYVAGVNGQAASFDGVDDFIEIVPGTNLANTHSVSFWIRADTDYYYLNQAIIIQKGEFCPDGNPNFLGNSYDLRISGKYQGFGNRDGCNYVTGVATEPDGNFDDQRILFSSNQPINTSQAHHIVITFDNFSKVFSINVDGEPVTTNCYYESGSSSQIVEIDPSEFDGINQTNASFKIGAAENWCGNFHSFANYFRGLIDEVRIYNRVLSEAEIQALFNETAEQDSDDDGVPDFQDNCPNTYNPDQADSDGDGVGDVCETNTVNPVGLWLYNASSDCTNYDNTWADMEFFENGKVSWSGYYGNWTTDGNQIRIIVSHDGYTGNLEGAISGDSIEGTGSWSSGVTFCWKSERWRDWDGDAHHDMLDNCPNTYNPDQLDSDFDGIGNVCDSNSLSIVGLWLYNASSDCTNYDNTWADMEFFENGKVSWSGYYGNWTTDGNQIRIIVSHDGYTGNLEGAISGDSIEGTGSWSSGTTWCWKSIYERN